MITDRPSNNGATESRGVTGKPSVTGEESSKINQLGTMAAEKAGEAVNYVRERGIKGLSGDISDAAVRHPLGAVAVSLGVGYFLGRLFSRK
jgi:ElaB/YqjD/DUF883 family membrane-anchored ribosome-binding protein